MRKKITKSKSAHGVSVQREVGRLCRGIVAEAINNGYADLWDESWNINAHIEVTLTIAELRCAASVINFHPTKAQLRRATDANDWKEYISELDGVE